MGGVMTKNDFYYVQSSVSKDYGFVTMNQLTLSGNKSEVGIRIPQKIALELLKVVLKYWQTDDSFALIFPIHELPILTLQKLNEIVEGARLNNNQSFTHNSDKGTEDKLNDYFW